MKIGIQTYGSRGDINPWVALGQKLARAGHQINLYYTSYSGSDFSHYAERNLTVTSTRDLDPASGVYAKVQAKPIYDLEITELTDYMVKEIFDLFEKEMILAGERLCQDSNLIINNPNLYHTACLAERYKIPRVNILVECQFSPSNRVSQYRDEHINNYFLMRINTYRDSLGLAPIHNVRDEIFNSGWLNLLAYSRVFSTDEESWGSRYKLCGYFDLDVDPTLTLSKELELFLAGGEKPIFISMGSLAFFEGASFAILPILLEAIELSGCRAIIQADWRQRSYRPDNNKNIHLVDYLPHHLILTKCLGVVHHGGAGTSHAALLNECPSIVIAYAWDQFYWGRELEKLGVSAGTIKRRYLDALQLAGAIRHLSLDPEFKQNAVQMRRNMKREKGLEKAQKHLLEAFAELTLITVEETVQ